MKSSFKKIDLDSVETINLPIILTNVTVYNQNKASSIRHIYIDETGCCQLISYDEILKKQNIEIIDLLLEGAIMQGFHEIHTHSDKNMFESCNFEDKKNFVIVNNEGNLLLTGNNGTVSAHSAFQTFLLDDKSKQAQTLDQNMLALSFLQVTLVNNQIKKILYDMTEQINLKVCIPLIEKLEEVDGNFNNLDTDFKKAMHYIIYEHTAEGLQKYGLMRENSFTEISSNPSLTIILAREWQRTILSVKTIKTVDDIMKFAKSLTDAGFCYAEYFPHFLKSEHFVTRNRSIRPTKEESESRITSPLKRLAISPGIGKHFFDFLPMLPDQENNEERRRGWEAGKSAFYKVSKKIFISKLLLAFDEKYIGSKLQEIIHYIKKVENEYGNSSIQYSNALEMKALQILEIKRNNSEFYRLLKKMQRNRIPFDKKERIGKSDEEIINHYTKISSIEKLSYLFDCKKPSILIASSSGTMARTLITALDIGTYANHTNSGKSVSELFHVQKSNIICNFLMAVLVYGGHHSMLELAEIQNRLLDQVAIELHSQLENRFINDNMQKEQAIQKASKMIVKFIEKNQVRLIAAHFQDFINAIDPSVRRLIERKYKKLKQKIKLQENRVFKF